ncbi:hypothetical protein F909_04073 [Acinetobacter sp. ANC 3929]|uniref:hypothetical protein n=1 Tax=Acinetobacter sp. ANC 3929 TaxID=1217707 RepID=UPI0002CE1F5D|nr:hypothetical protein [Acinetobacter sp. ANC 3929]ENW78384.1 hypothetical protein F909_04073 [Acinetobacter sp. ANC 3929]
MNAIQFIQQHGFERAREELTKLPNSNVTHMTDDARMFVDENNPLLDEFQRSQIKDLICIEELKRLVESLELVKEYGGISMAKRQCACFTNACTSVGVKPSPRLSALQQAIADYESIYGGEHV